MTADDKHPWAAFLDARLRALRWLRDEMHETPEQIARTMSMDPTQVRLLLMTDDAATAYSALTRQQREAVDIVRGYGRCGELVANGTHVCIQECGHDGPCAALANEKGAR